MRLFLFAWLLASAVHPAQAGRVDDRYDAVVVGGTPAGIAAAINASREGMHVALFEEHARIGGLTSVGMPNTDFRTHESLGGTWAEFASRVVEHYTRKYGPDSPQVKDSGRGQLFEPKVAYAVFQEMLKDAGVNVFPRHRLVSAETQHAHERPKLTRITVRNLADEQTYQVRAHVFVDATYEGDLLAAAGAEYRLGTEGREIFGERQAPEETTANIMGMNFRVHVTRDPARRIAFHKPEGYDPAAHSDIVEVFQSGELRGVRDEDNPSRGSRIEGGVASLKSFIQFLSAPNETANLNDRKGLRFSSYMVLEEAHDWPEGPPEKRAEIWRLAKHRAESFFYFLANDPRVPEPIRAEMSEWGYPRDEFEHNGNFPPWLYVREGRRLRGVETIIAPDLEADEHGVRARAVETSVAIGDHPMNSHGTHHGPDGEEQGNFAYPPRPYQMPYGIMIPWRLDGLIVPAAVSASHLAYGAIRMEPQWTALGQAAGLAAAQAVKTRRSLRDVDVEQLQEQLHAKGALTFYTGDVPPGSRYFRAVQFFGNRGLFQDLYPRDSPVGYGEGIRPFVHEAYLSHNIQPEKPLDEALAKKWLVHANRTFGTDLTFESFVAGAALPRGEVLNRLLSAVTTAGGRSP